MQHFESRDLMPTAFFEFYTFSLESRFCWLPIVVCTFSLKSSIIMFSTYFGPGFTSGLNFFLSTDVIDYSKLKSKVGAFFRILNLFEPFLVELSRLWGSSDHCTERSFLWVFSLLSSLKAFENWIGCKLEVEAVGVPYLILTREAAKVAFPSCSFGIGNWLCWYENYLISSIFSS